MWQGVMNYLWSTAKIPLNLIIGGINALIKGLNKVQIKIPDWSPVNPGATFGFNIPTIPRLAKGGIIAQPTQAIIGEAGTEAVMPLENNLEWLDILADKLASKIGSGNGAVNVYLDGRLIQRQLDRRKQQLAFATNGR